MHFDLRTIYFTGTFVFAVCTIAIVLIWYQSRNRIAGIFDWNPAYRNAGNQWKEIHPDKYQRHHQSQTGGGTVVAAESDPAGAGIKEEIDKRLLHERMLVNQSRLAAMGMMSAMQTIRYMSETIEEVTITTLNIPLHSFVVTGNNPISNHIL